MGDMVIKRDIPWIVDLYLQGRIKLDELISGRWRLDQINEAIADTKAAVRYIRKISRERGIDPNRIAAAGASATTGVTGATRAGAGGTSTQVASALPPQQPPRASISTSSSRACSTIAKHDCTRAAGTVSP